MPVLNKIRQEQDTTPDALNFTMPNGGTINLHRNGTPTTVVLEYSLDAGRTWTEWVEDANQDRIVTLQAGETVYIRNTSDTSTGFSTSQSNYYGFIFSAITDAHGNTNSLLCKNPANAVLTYSCFTLLFDGQQLLQTAPELPSVSLAQDCYRLMFRNCKGLTESPILPATRTVYRSYSYLFALCSNLNKITIYTESMYSTNDIYHWTEGVAASGDIYCPADFTIETGIGGIPSGWTRHDISETVPLNFTMPQGGTISLTKNGSPTAVSLEVSFDGMKTWMPWTERNNVRSAVLRAGDRMYVRNTSDTSTGFSVGVSDRYEFSFDADTYGAGNIDSLICKNPENAVLTAWCYTYLFFVTTYLKTSPVLANKTLADSCYRNMYYACNGLEAPPEMLAETLAENCCMAMFFNNTAITESPVLYATTLAENAYYSMFSGCSNLKKVTTYMTNINANDCLRFWMYDVSASGDFYCPQSLNITLNYSSGIPSGWTRHDL